MEKILDLIFGITVTNWKRIAQPFKRAGLNTPVFAVCLALWLCVVFVLSSLY